MRTVRNLGATARQREVLERVAAGEISKQVAFALGITEAGVRKHLESLRRRYGVSTRAALVRVAIERGELAIRLGDPTARRGAPGAAPDRNPMRDSSSRGTAPPR